MPRCGALLVKNGHRCNAGTGESFYGLVLCKTHIGLFTRTVPVIEDGREEMIRIWNRNQEEIATLAAQRARRDQRAAQNAQLNEGIVDEAVARRLAQIDYELWRAQNDVAPPRPRAPVGELAKIVNDPQNVHTKPVVKLVIETVERVLKIAVPPEYRCRKGEVSKTPGEIIAECHLGPKTVIQLISRYTAAEDIYGLGERIYGRVLDAVWQYIKNSADKEDLKKILKQELLDNIGMCLQGNLSRLCNVLAGYLDGIGPQEPAAEVLGREFPKLWDIDDDEERVAEGMKILDRVGVMEMKVRNEWLEAIM